MEAEKIKQLSMVDFLGCHYGMRFTRNGEGWKSLSPFKSETEPSFTVRMVEGRWLFKDFSSGYGGSLIDFVMLREGFSDVSSAMRYISQLGGESVSVHIPPGPGAVLPPEPGAAPPPKPRYDITTLYRTLRANDVTPCVAYLRNRAIAGDRIDDLCDGGILLHNKRGGRSYCCFAVYDDAGRLQCLDNHQIGGDDKFVLGRKHTFSRDWPTLAQSESVFVTEGIIDYLSVKTLEGNELPGVALLGRDIRIKPEWFASAKVIMSALDSDDPGVSAFFDLQAAFADKEISVYHMEGSKDPNEYAQSIRDGHKINVTLTNRQRREIYEDYLRTPNKSSVAAKWGINRSYMYEVVQKCQKAIDESERRPPGPRGDTEGKPQTLQEAWQRIEQLEAARIDAEKEKELYYARSEFLKIRLKFRELDNAELRGEKQPDEGTESAPKRQIKKKRKK